MARLRPRTCTEAWKLIKDNPRQRLSSPEAEDKEMNFLQSEETAEYIKVLYEIDIKWRLVYLAALMGAYQRRSSCL